MKKTITQEASSQSFAMLTASGNQNVWHIRILLALRSIGQGNKSDITKEINRLIPNSHTTEERVHKRMSELVERNLVEDTGKLKLSLTTGRKQTVWMLKL